MDQRRSAAGLIAVLVLASHGAALAQLPAMPPLPQGPLPWPSTTGRRYKSYTYNYDVATPTFDLGLDVCTIILLSASQNTSGATDIYQNGRNARQNGHVLSLRTLVSRPPPHDGGNLHRQLFSGFYLTTANDIHNAMDEAINAGTPATLLRVQHTLQFLVQFKLTIDEWERAIANVRLNTTKGRSQAIKHIDTVWAYYTGNPDATKPDPMCDDNIAFHIDNWATYTTAQYHPTISSFLRMTIAETLNDAVTAIRARNATQLEALGSRFVSLHANFGIGALLFVAYTADLAVLCDRPLLLTVAHDFAYNIATTTAAILVGKGLPRANATAFMNAALPSGNRTGGQSYATLKPMVMDIMRSMPDMDPSLVGQLNGSVVGSVWLAFGPLVDTTNCTATLQLPPT